MRFSTICGSDPAPSRTGRTGFTLIEVLVVVGIVAVVASLLIPALGTVQEAARRSACASNLRQMGMGVILYAAEHEDLLPCSHIKGDAPSWAVPSSYPGIAPPFTWAAWSDAVFVGQYLDAPETLNGQVGSISTVRARGIWRCPADAARPGLFGVAKSYCIDYGLNTNLSKDFTMAGGWVTSLRLGQIIRASSMLMLGETRSCRWATSETPLPTVVIHDPRIPPSMLAVPLTSSLVGRHRGSVNFFVADGHVQSFCELTELVGAGQIRVHNTWTP